MSVQENIELVRSITERGLNQGDVSFVDEAFSPSYVVHARGLDLPKGPGAFKVAVRFWRQSFPDFHTSIEQMIGEGEFVASRFSTTGTHTGKLGEMPPTGRRFTVSGVDLHRVVDGKVVESWISDDMPRILMEIGVLAPAGGPPKQDGLQAMSGPAAKTGPAAKPAPAAKPGPARARAGRQR
jgi:predicted ester cyclase